MVAVITSPTLAKTGTGVQVKLAAPPCVFAKNVPFSRTDADALFEHAVPTYRTPVLVAVYVRLDADDVTDVGVPTVNVVQSILPEVTAPSAIEFVLTVFAPALAPDSTFVPCVMTPEPMVVTPVPTRICARMT